MCQNSLKDEKQLFHSVQFLVLQPLTWHQQHFPQSEVWRSCPSLFPEERWEVSWITLERLNIRMKLILAILNTYVENFSIFFHAKYESQLKTCVRIWLDRQSQVFWADVEAIFVVLVNVFMITSKDCIIIIIIISITIPTVCPYCDFIGDGFLQTLWWDLQQLGHHSDLLCTHHWRHLLALCLQCIVSGKKEKHCHLLSF